MKLEEMKESTKNIEQWFRLHTPSAVYPQPMTDAERSVKHLIDICKELIQQVEELEVENAKLKEALEPFAKYYRGGPASELPPTKAYKKASEALNG